MPLNHRNLPFFIHMLQSLLMALWLWNFLPTMAELHLLQSPNSFIFILIIFALAELVPSRLFRTCAAFLASIVYMNYYFRPTGDTIFQGISYLFSSDVGGMSSVLHGELASDPLQTHLFLLILAVLYWLVVYAASRPKMWVLYSLLGVFVFALIDGNTPVHPNRAIVVVLFVSILNLGLIQFASLTMQMRLQNVQWPRFFVPFSILVSVMFCMGFLLPKQPAVWANPFMHVGDRLQQSGDSSVHMVGYELNDSRLGGSFVLDHTPVMSVVEDRASYMRGQSLTVYTGKGWVAADLDAMPENNAYEYVGGSFSNPEHFAFSHMPTKPLSQSVQVLSDKLDTHDLLTGWAVNKVDSVSGMPKNTTLSLDLLDANLNAPNLKSGDSYVISTEQLQDPYNVLAVSSLNYTQMRQQLYGKSTNPVTGSYLQNMTYYTQLPVGLPLRVHSLAKQIVGNANTEYQMVTKIQDYLKQNYTYTNTGVPVPGVNQDYVDQFLFTSKKGYCNNFSSAMAVMLRTLDIPTRWVTGFTDGELDPNYNGEGERYLIRESDAHSWVEVLFPHYGWIPFDPTPNYEMDFAKAAATVQSSNPSGGVQSKTSRIPLNLPQTTGASSVAPSAFSLAGFLSTALWVLVLLIGATLFFVWLLRSKIIVNRLGRVFAKGQGQIPPRPIAHLVQELQKKGNFSEEKVTVRELRDAAKKYGIDAMDYSHFVKTVEDTWYGGQIPTHEDTARLQKTWKTWLLTVLRSRKDRS